MDLDKKAIRLYRNSELVDKARFVGVKELADLEFEETSGAPKLWEDTDENGSYKKGNLPDCLESGWRLEVGGVKYPITVKGQGVLCYFWTKPAYWSEKLQIELRALHLTQTCARPP